MYLNHPQHLAVWCYPQPSICRNQPHHLAAWPQWKTNIFQFPNHSHRFAVWPQRNINMFLKLLPALQSVASRTTTYFSNKHPARRTMLCIRIIIFCNLKLFGLVLEVQTKFKSWRKKCHLLENRPYAPSTINVGLNENSEISLNNDDQISSTSCTVGLISLIDSSSFPDIIYNDNLWTLNKM